MNSRDSFHLTLEECKLILDNIKGLVVIDEKGIVKFLSSDMGERLTSLGANKAEEAYEGIDIAKVHPSSKIKKVLETNKETIGVYVYNGQPNISRMKPIYENDKLLGAIDYDLLLGSNEFETFLSQTDKIFFNLEDMKADLSKIKGAERNRYSIGDIKGESNEIVELKQKIYSVAETDSTVLITGETGTGKELVAHSIHCLSRRSKNPFIEINCAAIPENLVESELFGYEDGAFTGATRGGRQGKFEMANRGTIFLDEIDQLAYHLQPKLLRVLQEKEINRIGGVPFPVDVRVIAATNKDLKSLVRKGDFREDLYYRLNVIDIDVPPLRQRKEDISILANQFVENLSRIIGKKITGISEEGIKMLEEYNWPGNIRELINTIERAVNMSDNGESIIHSFSNLLPQPTQNGIYFRTGGEKTLKDLIEDMERREIIQALSSCGDKQSEAARKLGISRQNLHNKIKKYGITR